MSASRRCGVVITGGTQGLGAAIARTFLSQGWEVLSLYHSNDVAAEQFTDSLSADQRPHFTCLKFDITSGVPDLKIPATWERLIVVHNACSAFQPSAIHAVDTEQMERLFRTNVVGASHLLQATLKPLARTRGIWISVLTQALRENPKGFSHYLAAKAALETWTRAAEAELASKQVRFLSVYPGYMETQLTRSWPEILRGTQTAESTRSVAERVYEQALQ